MLAVAGTACWGLLYYSFGVLLGPMADALRASETAISAAFSIALLAAAAAAPIVGRAVDRVGAGPVMSVGSALGALGFVAASSAGSAAWLYVSWAVLGVAHACTSYEPAFAAVTAWFPESGARRRALLVLTSFGGLASPLFVPFAAIVVTSVGFRPGVLVFAAVLALVVTPLHAAVATVRYPPAPPPPRSASASTPMPLALLGAVLSIHAFASTSLAAFAFPALVERQVAPLDAAALAGLVGAAQVPARLLYAPMCRWVPGRARLSMLLAVQAAALAGVGALSGPGLALALLAFGAANGLVTLERAWVVAEWFGLDGYGARSGTLAAGSMLARAAAPLSMALIARHASYPWAFGIVACGLLVAVGMQVVAEVRRSTEPGAAGP
jgi:hypothetical protein